MLLRFACSNFRSIKEKQEILFTAAKHVKEHDEAARTVDGLPKQRVLPVVALYGANASGKSNMLKALEFLKRAVLRSHVDWEKGIDRQPFRLDPEWKEQPSSFEIDFLLEGVRYHYGFVCDDKVVREEWLYAKPHGRVLQSWFYRKEGEETEFGKAVRLQGEAIRKAGMEKPESLIFSLILQANSAKIVSLFNYFSGRFSFPRVESGGRETTTLMLDPDFAHRVNEIMRISDVGIETVGIQFLSESISNEEIASRVDVRDLEFRFLRYFDQSEDDQKKQAVFLRALAENQRLFAKPFFYHKGVGGTNGEFAISEESHGTEVLFNLSGEIFLTIENGGVVCIDEIDSGLHTLLSRAIIHLFMDPKTNPKGAQLLFTTHDTNLLSTDVLRRDQVWLTEKDQGGATHTYPLSDFKTKPTDDIEAGYLAGRFGAVPYLPPWRSLIGGEG